MTLKTKSILSIKTFKGVYMLVQILKSILKHLEKTEPRYKIGNVKTHNSLVDSLVPSMVKIGDNFISAPGSIILAHDASLLIHFNKYRVEKTVIGNNVFLGANAVVLAGVTIGDGAIIGAGSVVSKNVESNMVVAGNPARVISSVQEYYEKCEAKSILYTPPKGFKNIFLNKPLKQEDKIAFEKSILNNE